MNVSNNRLSAADGYSYDAAGNTAKDPQGRKFTFDAENKQVKVDTLDANGGVTGTVGEYSYDGDGRRVKKYVPSTGETTVFVYDAGGKLVAEYSTIVAPQTQAKVSYLTSDHLGSPRINTDQSGAVISRHDYHPFGEEISTTQRSNHPEYAGDGVRKQFTGYERDKETELDFAQARYYAKELGRFTGPDPLLASGMPDNPQTWNRYAYVLNNPLFWVDSTGLIWGKNEDGQVKWFDKKLGRGFSEFAPENWQYEEKNGRIIQLDANSSKWNYIDPVEVVAEPNPIQELVNSVAENAESKGRTIRMAGTVAGVVGTCIGTAGAGCAGAVEMGTAIINAEIESAETAAADTSTTAVHGNSLASPKPTWVYELYDNDGNFLKNGITSQEKPENRYTKGFMEDKQMQKDLYPNRREARAVERYKNTVNPGPLNRRR